MPAMHLRRECDLLHRWLAVQLSGSHTSGAAMLTAYEPIGLPIGPLFLSCLSCVGGVGLVVWVVYWLYRRFRARGPVTRFGRSVLWSVVSLAFLVVVLFPPVRQAGIWWTNRPGSRCRYRRPANSTDSISDGR